MAKDQISVIVPVLNEKHNLPKLLEQLGQFSFMQVIIVDGGSEDGSWQWLQDYKKASSIAGLKILVSEAGRALQMNAGAEHATAKILLFLHADTELPSNAIEKIRVGIVGLNWGRFDVAFKEPDLRMALIAWCMNWRSRITGVSTGDQAMFVQRKVFQKLQGFANLPLMEDVELSKRLLKQSRPACLKVKALTSARRWLNHGVTRTVVLMWRLRWAYFIGVSPEKLAKKYQTVR